MTDDNGNPISSALEKALQGVSRWTEEERGKYIDELADNPLFLPSMTETEQKSNTIVSALKSAEYDEIDTPFTLANESKTKGNDAFARGAEWFPNAIKHYNEGIKHCEKAMEIYNHQIKKKNNDNDETPTTVVHIKTIRKLLSVLHANLAAIYMQRGKYISVLDSCRTALRLWGDNTKAVYRSAKVCIDLGRATTALEFIELGLTIEPENTSFLPLQKEAKELLARQERIAAATAKEQRTKFEKLITLREACKERKILIGPPLYSSMRRTHANPYVDEEGSIHWPVLLLYPQYNQSDYLEDVQEGATIYDILSYIFQPNSPPPLWDTKREYVLDNIEVFFRTYPCKPIDYDLAWSSTVEGVEPENSPLSSRYVRIPMVCPLIVPLTQRENVIADIPVLYIVAKSSNVYQEMKKSSGGDFVTLRLPDWAMNAIAEAQSSTKI